MADAHIPCWETGLLLVVAGVAVGVAACLSVAAPVGLRRTWRR